MTNDDESRSYVESHFWRIGELADAAGASVAQVEAAIAARCVPQATYRRGPDGWWSALDRASRAAPTGEAWYSRGAAWTLRRALFAQRRGATLVEVARLLEDEFAEAFAAELERTADAVLRFPNCFADGAMDRVRAHDAGREEWGAWIDGGYGVCLRIFTAQTCVAKEALAAAMKDALGADDYDVTAMLVAAERLASVILPFAPWQRPDCTPGKTIDRLLDDQHLGSDRPGSVASLHAGHAGSRLVRESGSA